MRNLFFLILFAYFFQSCTPPAIENNAENQYFDMDSLVSDQILLLSESKRTALKTVEIDGEKEAVEISPDQDQWKKELIGLLDFDIKKSRYLGAFDIEKNSIKESYQLKAKENAPIKSLFIEKEKNGTIKKLTGKIQDDEASMVYTTCQVYEVQFSEGIIAEIDLIGYQKMVTKDTVFYRVNIKIEK